ncbi:MAG: hypothetical protein HY724_05735 [Candidatus Rokubacteria bacterium]|nr:hypothetical protein [Candidatus Rokubacteria bacterium]
MNDERLLILESTWNERGEYLRPEMSVLPFFRGMTEAMAVPMVFRQFNAKEDLRLLLQDFAKDRRFRYCYIAAHGGDRKIYGIGREEIKLTAILTACGNAEGKGFIFGACRFVTKEIARRFLWETRARFVAGYAKDIDWIHSTLVDLAFFTYLFRGSSQDAFRAAKKLYQDNRLARRLGFTVYRRDRAPGEVTASLKR